MDAGKHGCRVLLWVDGLVCSIHIRRTGENEVSGTRQLMVENSAPKEMGLHCHQEAWSAQCPITGAEAKAMPGPRLGL